MKFTTANMVAALAGVAAAKDSRTFAVLHFNGKELTKGRVDPIISPGEVFTHVHSVMGGSNFGKSATGKDLLESNCSNANVKGDNSAYWFPSLYFHDPKTGEFESVDMYYFNAYYFFEATNDDIKAFPVGLNIVSGSAMTRVMPETGATANLDPSKGAVNPARITCPRLNNIYDPPSWNPDSDGTTQGVGDPINLGEGVGFPYRTCDGLYSPLRADVHFPSCYNPDAGLTDYKNNMVFPSDNDGKLDCPDGYTHLPHLFYEVYWDTQSFQGRWEEGQVDQPFVWSNGDVTGYSSHADFIAGWDEDLLQHIIDTCDAGTSGMDNCPGLFYGTNSDECHIASGVDEKVDGTLTKLPGDNPLSGFKYGSGSSGSGSSSSSASTTAKASSATSKVSSAAESTVQSSAAESTTESTDAQSTAASSTDYSIKQVPTSEVSQSSQTAEAVSSTNVYTSPATSPATSQTEEAQATNASTQAAKFTTCKQRVHTVWSTVTVTAEAPKQTGYKRDFIRRHARGHGRH